MPSRPDNHEKKPSSSPTGRIAAFVVAALLVVARVAAVGFAALRPGRSRRSPEPDSPPPADRSAELVAAALLAMAGLAAAGFVVVYVVSGNTQLLGLTIGCALLFGGVALAIAASSLVVDEQAEEARATFSEPPELPESTGSSEEATGSSEEDEAVTAVESAVAGSSRITRRKLLMAAGGVAGAGIGAAAITPLASLGPAVGDTLIESAWAEGVSLLDENKLPVKAEDIVTGSFLTAWAAGSDRRFPVNAVVVVRVREEELDLPEDRRDWAPGGLLAFSKLCTHAGCAVSLFRYPLFPEASPGPALVCPCHYSTFDVTTGGDRIFGPAARPLPQLPLTITAGELFAAGPLSGPPGPSHSGMPVS